MMPGSKMARASWGVGYLFFFLAGIVAFFSPAQVVERTLYEILAYSWAGFLTFGGVICLGGKLLNNWAGEVIGLPPLSAANYIFGVLLLIVGTTPASIAIGGIFCGIGTALIGRWIEVRKLAQINREVNSER